jgi:MULE transposase domain
MSLEQIRMARRFVSDFMYETDTTFNTNVLKLPLSVIVGINNTGSTFPVAYCYITSESTTSFM